MIERQLGAVCVRLYKGERGVNETEKSELDCSSIVIIPLNTLDILVKGHSVSLSSLGYIG